MLTAPAPGPAPAPELTPWPLVHWVEGGHARSAHWRSERGAPPPRRVVLADDTLTAAMAQRLASEGTAMLWRGDFHNARQLLQALARRIDQPKGARKSSSKQEQTIYTSQAQKAKKASNFGSDRLAVPPSPTSPTEASVPAAAFHRHRQAQSQRARLLGMVLLSFGPDHGLALRRAPDVRQACAQGWGEPTADATGSVASLRELLALTSAHEWARQGVEVPALGEAPLNRIHPRYGVFSPVRGEYVALVAQAPLPGAADTLRAFDIGTGTGVLAAVLARRGVAQVVATDLDERALACARANQQRLAPG
ncbi:50S ribosomal protein L11 methyltransferase, partial [Hydrogenophaga sp.]|uniref:50S ribosomal protein L11 methyltransferase n=1 Tax=Hydrogenophaga sp. TaxID=1904254 RepID=UPI0039FD6128